MDDFSRQKPECSFSFYESIVLSPSERDGVRERERKKEKDKRKRVREREGVREKDVSGPDYPQNVSLCGPYPFLLL